MAFQYGKYALRARDQCPVCDGVITLALIEPHVSRSGLEIHTFRCEKCGPIKSMVVEITPTETPPQLAA
jgi:hypothetical protein